MALHFKYQDLQLKIKGLEVQQYGICSLELGCYLGLNSNPLITDRTCNSFNELENYLNAHL